MYNMKNKLKILLLGLCTLLIGFLIYKIIAYKEPPFKNIDINKTSMILNGSSLPFVDTILYVGLDDMGIRNIIVSVYDLTDEMKIKFSSSIELKANLYINNGHYYLWIDNMSRKDAVKVVSHELIHFKQYHNKELSIENRVLLWQDKPVNLESVYYHDRPWEIEAFAKQDSIYKILMKQLF